MLSTKLLAKHLLIPSILVQERVHKYQPSHTLGHSFMDPYISVFLPSIALYIWNIL